MSYWPLVVAYGAMFYEGALNIILSALMLPLTSVFNVDVGQIALLIAIKNLFTLICLYFSGVLSDKFGRKLFIGIGSCFFLLFLIIMIFSHNYFLVLIGAAFAGIGHGLMDAPSQSLIFDVFSDKAAAAMSFVQVFFAGGAMLLSLLAAQFINLNIDYRFVFVVISIVGVLLLIISRIIKYPNQIHVDNSHSNASINYSKLFWLLSLTFCYGCYFILLITWLPLYLRDILNFDDSLAVLMLTLNQLGSIAGSLLWAYVLSKVRLVSLMRFNALLGLIGLSGLLLIKNVLIIFIVVIMLGFVLGNFFSCCIGMGGELFSLRKGWITGLVASANMAAGFILASISGLIVGLFGVWLVFGFAWLFMLGCFLLINIIYRLYYVNSNGKCLEKNLT